MVGKPSCTSLQLIFVLIQLKNLGYSVTATKSARIFRQCDCDQSGKIDRDEFKKALFMIDPITANSTHIIPTCLPVPRDVFHYFDEDGNGMIDDMEFAVRNSSALEFSGSDHPIGHT